MKFVMAGGGTGGHIIPALAVAEELRRKGHEPFFIGTRQGMEARLVPAKGFPIEWIEIGGMNRAGLKSKLRALWLLLPSTWKSWRILRRMRPGALFSMGGYVAGPPVLAAAIAGVPIVSMEPNAVPGFTNRKMASWTSRALVNFAETTSYFPAGRAEVTGVPVRREFFSVPDKSADAPFTVLITGGSQGSRTLNNAGRECWRLLAKSGAAVRVIHQGGRQGADLVGEFRDSGVDGEFCEFIQDMPAAMGVADLIVCRAGASTVSELAAAGRASVLVPFPFAADDHQTKNAEAMVRVGAARMLLDAEMTGQRLFEEVMSLKNQPDILATMRQQAKSLAKPRAAERAAEVLEQVAVR